MFSTFSFFFTFFSLTIFLRSYFFQFVFFFFPDLTYFPVTAIFIESSFYVFGTLTLCDFFFILFDRVGSLVESIIQSLRNKASNVSTQPIKP